MELTCRALRKLRLIYGNIAKTLNPARLKSAMSGLVERLVRVSPNTFKNIYFFHEFSFCKRRNDPKPTDTNKLDARKAWEDNLRPFCKLTTACGTQWTCDGQGNWHFFKAISNEVEPTMIELFQFFGVKRFRSFANCDKGAFFRVFMLPYFKIGQSLPMENFKRTQEREGCHGNTVSGGCAKCQSREASYPKCDKHIKSAYGINCSLKSSFEQINHGLP